MSKADTFWTLHQRACERNEATYKDPDTGYSVFTEVGLRARGRCCGAGCRHCPYAHEGVHLQGRATQIKQPAWLTEARPAADTPTTVLFSSGGKDSFLAHRALTRSNTPVVWLTTFSADSHQIAHQEVSIERVVEQAQALAVPLIGVPLHPARPYMDQVAVGLALLNDIAGLAFGDLHLEYVRQWRSDTFGEHPATQNLPLRFPLWHTPYQDLLADLEQAGVSCRVSAVTRDDLGFDVGDRLDAEALAKLPADVDQFGEHGEFHTLIGISSPPAT